MAQNISITDKNGVKHFIFYHSIINVDMGLQDISTGDPYYRCTVYYLALSSYPALVSSTICTKACTVEGDKAQRLYTAVRNGVLDLDEGDFISRLEAEHSELVTKLEKLDKFLASKAAKSISLYQAAMLQQQRTFMDSYAKVLQMRISDLKGLKPQPDQPTT